jgi:L-2,4-diaminobutyrate decarboxylase
MAQSPTPDFDPARPDPTRPDRRFHDPERFRDSVERLTARLADWLAVVLAPEQDVPVSTSFDPRRSASDWSAPLPAKPTEDRAAWIDRFAEQVLAGSHRIHNPRSVGHQVAPVVPELAAVEMLTTLLNNSTAVHEMGPIAAAIEADLVRRLGALVGFDDRRCGGVLVHGGSLGNLTALVAARSVQGFGGKRFCVLVSEQAHYCVGRAMLVMNQEKTSADDCGGVVHVPVDEAFRMRIDALEEALESARSSGREVLAVVASAGSTATGAIDSIDACADFCDRHGLWLHVDGAHGASLVFSDSGREALHGIERADSIVWDAHKMMLTPSLCTMLLFRDHRAIDRAFVQDASYLFRERTVHGADDVRDDADLDHGRRTIECTKPALAFRLRALFDLVGTEALGAYVERQNVLARAFTAELLRDPRFEVLLEEPDLNIVCFRLLDDAGTALADATQDLARDRVLASGRFYLTRTKLRGSVWLRCTLMHPHTTLADLRQLLDELAAAAH